MHHDKHLPEKLKLKLQEKNFCIFLFHGVIKNHNNKIRNYTGKHIDEDIFLESMRELRKFGNPVSMNEILYYCSNKKPLPPNSFAITFDDGFENNLSVAAPILHDFSIPCMIYITSKFIDENAMSWTDKIEYAVEESHLKKIDEPFKNISYNLNTTQEKITFLSEVRKIVKNNISIDPNQYADNLCKKLRIEINTLDNENQLDKKISWTQIKMLKNSELIHFGGHSHTHSILSFLNEDQLNFEIKKSLGLLKAKGNYITEHYSYPEGLKNCYSKNVISVLKDNGIKCCPTAIEGFNNEKTNTFELKRILVG